MVRTNGAGFLSEFLDIKGQVVGVLFLSCGISRQFVGTCLVGRWVLELGKGME